MSEKTMLTYFRELPFWAKLSTITSLSIGIYTVLINTQNTIPEAPYIFILFTLFASLFVLKNVNQKRTQIRKRQKEKKEYAQVQEEANLWLKNLKKDLHKEIKNIKMMYAKKGKDVQNQVLLDQEILTLDDSFTLVVNLEDQRQVFLLDNTDAAAQNPIQANRINTVQRKLKDRGISSKLVVSKQTPTITVPIIEYNEENPQSSVKFPPHLINLN